MLIPLLIHYTLVFACVLTLVALGGALVMRYLPSSINAFLAIVIVFTTSAVVGLIYSLLLSLAVITIKANQTITGTAINILAPALATVIVKAVTHAETGKAEPRLNYINIQEKFTFNIGNLKLNWFIVVMIIIVIVSYILLYKTKFGLRLMACGEHPQAADSVGINVSLMRYIGVSISGALGGFGGLAFIASVNSEWSFDMGVMGFGFLALAVMIFGQWKPTYIFLSSLLFGFFRTLSLQYSAIGWLAALKIDGSIYNMIPYIVCLIVLTFTSKKSRAPKAEGIPYDKGQR